MKKVHGGSTEPPLRLAMRMTETPPEHHISVSRMKATNILVVGAGIFGASAALELRLRGHSVALMDPGPLPHPDASSTDVNKIVRADYGGDTFYSRFARECIPEWHRWNAKAGRTLYHETGFLVLAGEKMRPGGFEHDSREAMRSLGQGVKPMDGEHPRRRFPAWTSRNYPDGYFNPHAGWAESGNVLEWVLTLASDAGVVFQVGQRSVSPTSLERISTMSPSGTRLT